MFMKILLLIVSLVILCKANRDTNLPTCDSNKNNCEQFSFEQFQRNSSNVSASIEQKTLKVGLVQVENRILFDNVPIKEDGNLKRFSKN